MSEEYDERGVSEIGAFGAAKARCAEGKEQARREGVLTACYYGTFKDTTTYQQVFENAQKLKKMQTYNSRVCAQMRTYAQTQLSRTAYFEAEHHALLDHRLYHVKQNRYQAQTDADTAKRDDVVGAAQSAPTGAGTAAAAAAGSAARLKHPAAAATATEVPATACEEGERVCAAETEQAGPAHAGGAAAAGADNHEQQQPAEKVAAAISMPATASLREEAWRPGAYMHMVAVSPSGKPMSVASPVARKYPHLVSRIERDVLMLWSLGMEDMRQEYVSGAGLAANVEVKIPNEKVNAGLTVAPDVLAALKARVSKRVVDLIKQHEARLSGADTAATMEAFKKALSESDASYMLKAWTEAEWQDLEDQMASSKVNLVVHAEGVRCSGCTTCALYRHCFELWSRPDVPATPVAGMSTSEVRKLLDMLPPNPDARDDAVMFHLLSVVDKEDKQMARLQAAAEKFAAAPGKAKHVPPKGLVQAETRRQTRAAGRTTAQHSGASAGDALAEDPSGSGSDGCDRAQGQYSPDGSEYAPEVPIEGLLAGAAAAPAGDARQAEDAGPAVAHESNDEVSLLKRKPPPLPNRLHRSARATRARDINYADPSDLEGLGLTVTTSAGDQQGAWKRLRSGTTSTTDSAAGRTPTAASSPKALPGTETAQAAHTLVGMAIGPHNEPHTRPSGTQTASVRRNEGTQSDTRAREVQGASCSDGGGRRGARRQGRAKTARTQVDKAT